MVTTEILPDLPLTGQMAVPKYSCAPDQEWNHWRLCPSRTGHFPIEYFIRLYQNTVIRILMIVPQWKLLCMYMIYQAFKDIKWDSRGWKVALMWPACFPLTSSKTWNTLIWFHSINTENLIYCHLPGGGLSSKPTPRGPTTSQRLACITAFLGFPCFTINMKINKGKV